MFPNISDLEHVSRSCEQHRGTAAWGRASKILEPFCQKLLDALQDDEPVTRIVAPCGVLLGGPPDGLDLAIGAVMAHVVLGQFAQQLELQVQRDQPSFVPTNVGKPGKELFLAIRFLVLKGLDDDAAALIGREAAHRLAKKVHQSEAQQRAKRYLSTFRLVVGAEVLP